MGQGGSGSPGAGHIVTTESAIYWPHRRAKYPPQWTSVHGATPALGSLETSEPSEQVPFLPGIMATCVRLTSMVAHGLDIRSNDDTCVNGEKRQACSLEKSGPWVVLITAYHHRGPLSQATPYTALCSPQPWAPGRFAGPVPRALHLLSQLLPLLRSGLFSQRVLSERHGEQADSSPPHHFL